MRAVKKYLFFLLSTFIIIGGLSMNTKAQSLELLGGNTLNGAMNGVVLGGATMAIQNSNSFKPVQIGLGAGTLYGIGVGVHDMSQVSEGQQFYISGSFNDAENSSILVLLDTFYGAAAGTVIASSIALIIQGPLVDALQYGSGFGAWAGFGYGLFDAFVLAEGPNFGRQATLSQNDVSGFLTYQNASNSISVGMFSPKLVTHKEVTSNSIKQEFTASLNVIQLQVDL